MFEWQHNFIIDKLLSYNLKELCLKYIMVHGNNMQSVDELKSKIIVYVTNGSIQKGYDIVVSIL